MWTWRPTCFKEAAGDSPRKPEDGSVGRRAGLRQLPSNLRADAKRAVYHVTHRIEVERDSRKLIRLLERDGWVRVAVRRSHWQFKHPERPGRITVPHPDRDIKRGTLASIYRQAGWTLRRD